jgi:ligand-binding sensor domain-containing protein
MYMHGWAQHPVATVKYSYNQFTRFKNYSIHDGLSNVPVFDILKDKRGFLWLATGDGLVRFDGHSFLYYRYKPKDSTSIPYSDCRALAEDWQGRIWVGTTNGLGCLDPVSGLCSRYYKGADSLSLILQNDVRALLVCSDGYLWAEQTGGVLSRINLQRQRAAHFKRNGREKVTVHYFFVHETRNRRILAGGGHNEPFCYDKKNGQTSLLNRNPDRSKNPFYIATNMLEDESGLYWITNQENGLTIYNPQTDTLSHGRLPSLYTITADGKGNIFMGGLISGLMQFNTRTNKFTRYMPNENNPLSIPSKHICKLYFDSDGNLWIGHSKGLSLYSPHANKFHHVWHIPETPSLSSNTITSICQVDQDNIWFGTREQGATLYHLPDNLFTTYKEVKDDPSTLSSNWITAIDHDSKNRVWFSLWTGHESAINSFNPATGKFTRHLATDNYYWYFDVKCQGENIFAGSWGTGLLECDKKTNKFVISYPAHEESTIPFRQVAPFLNADSTGNIWFGTSRYYNPNTNKSKIFDISYGIRRRTIRSVNTPFQTDFPSNILMQLVDHSNRLCILCNLSRILVLDPADETLIPIKFNLHNYYNLALGHNPVSCSSGAPIPSLC